MAIKDAFCLPRAAKVVLQGWARWGYAARGIVHAGTGALGLATAYGARGAEPMDGAGVLLEIFRRPAGAALVAVLAIGLVGFGVWRVYESFTEEQPSLGWRIALRASAILSAITHALLATFAVKLLLGEPAPTGEQAAEMTAAELLAVPYGQWLIVALGVGTFGIGVTCILRGLCARITKDLDTDGAVDRGVWSLGAFGHVAQGAAMSLTGGFFLRAAWRSRPRDAASVKGVLEEVAAQPLGPWLLALVSAGILAYGLFGVSEAIFRRMPSPDAEPGDAKRRPSGSCRTPAGARC